MGIIKPSYYQDFIIQNSLQRVLKVAATVPGNRDRFQAAGLINPSGKLVSDWQDAFKQLTPIDKHTVRHNPGLFLADATDVVYRGMTSGSRGKHFIYFAGAEWNQVRIAARRRSLAWWNIDDNTPIINVASRLLPVRPVDMAIAGVIDDDFINSLLKLLQEHLCVIRGYPSRLCEVATKLINNKIPPVQAVICTGEYLFDFQQQLLAAVFNAPVIVEYGCQETGISGMTCPEAGRLHLDSDRAFYEVIDGELVTTDLFNYVMPLVRYKCGDVLELDEEPCVCGRPGLTAKILGRIEDKVKTREGVKYPGEIIMPPLDSILNYQVVRQQDHIDIWLQPQPGEISLEALSDWIQTTFGEVSVQILLDDSTWESPKKFSVNSTSWIRTITEKSWSDWFKQGYVPEGDVKKTAQLLQQLVNPAVLVNSGLSPTTKALLWEIVHSSPLEPQVERITARVLLFACNFLAGTPEIEYIYNQAAQRLQTINAMGKCDDAANFDLLVPSLYVDSDFAKNIWANPSSMRLGKLDTFNVHNLLIALETAAQIKRVHLLRPIVSILIGDFNFFAPKFGTWLLAYWCELLHGQAIALNKIQPPKNDKFVVNWLMWRQQLLKGGEEMYSALSKLQSAAKSPAERARVCIEKGYGILISGKQLEPREWLKILKQNTNLINAKLPNNDIDPVPWIPILRSLSQSLLEIGEKELAYQCLVASATPNSRTSGFERLAFQVNDKQSMILDCNFDSFVSSL
jgi:phenylacetate-coenzyme A ligase PaaK-like adenylate-forming protein